MALTAYGIEPDIVNYNAVVLGYNTPIPSKLVFQYTDSGGVTAYYAVLRRRQINNSPNNVSFITVYRSTDGINWTAYPSSLSISTPSAGEGGGAVLNVCCQREGNTVYFVVGTSSGGSPAPMKMLTFNLDTRTYGSVDNSGILTESGNVSFAMFVLNGVARIVHGRTLAGAWGWFYITWSSGSSWSAEEIALNYGAVNQNLMQAAFNPTNGDVAIWIPINNVNNVTVRHAGVWTTPIAFFPTPGINPSLHISAQPGIYSPETDSWIFPSSAGNAGPHSLSYIGIIVKASPSANPTAPTLETIYTTVDNFTVQYPIIQEQQGTLYYSWVLYGNMPSQSAQQLLQSTRLATSGSTWSQPTVIWDAGPSAIYKNPPSVANAVLGVQNMNINVLTQNELVTFANPPTGGFGGSTTEYFLVFLTLAVICPPSAATLLQPFTGSVTSTGGAPPVTFTITSGMLPPGLSLAPSGAITGVPTIAGSFNPTFQASDTSGLTATKTCTMQVCPTPTRPCS